MPPGALPGLSTYMSLVGLGAGPQGATPMPPFTPPSGSQAPGGVQPPQQGGQPPQGVDIAGAFRVGEQAAQQDGGGFARGGVVRGYAGGGGVSDGGLGSISPMFLEMTRRQMATMARGGPVRGYAGGSEVTGGDSDMEDLQALLDERQPMAVGDGSLTSEDKGLALAKAGFAAAAGQSRHAMQNFGVGAATGVDALMKMKQARALQRMKEATLNQTQQYHNDQIRTTMELRKIEAKRAADQAKRDADRATHDANMETLAQNKLDAAADAESWSPGGVTPDGKVVLVNKKTGETKNIDANPKGAALPGIPKEWEDKSPEELRKVVPNSDLKLADAMIEGRIQAPSGATRSPRAQYMLSLVQILDPTFDASNTSVRFDTARDFGSKGASGKLVNSGNTLIGHLGSMDANIDKLGNTDFLTGANSFKNWAASKSAKWSPETTEAVAKMKMDSEFVGKELTRLLAGARGGTGAEAEAAMEHFNNAKTPTELHAAVQEAVTLLKSRMDELGYQKETGMKKPTDMWNEFYNPSTRKVLQKLAPDYAVELMQFGKPAPAEAAPPPVAAPAAAAAPSTIMPGGGPQAAPRSSGVVIQNGMKFDKATHKYLGPA